MAAVICDQANVHNSGSSFLACWKRGIDLFPMNLSLCANIMVMLSNILLQSGSRRSQSMMQLKYSLSSFSLFSERLLLLSSVAGQSGCRVPFSLESIGLSVALPASCPVRAGVFLTASSQSTRVGSNQHHSPMALARLSLHVSRWEHLPILGRWKWSSDLIAGRQY